LFLSSLGFGNFIECSCICSVMVSGHAQHACGFGTGGFISSVLTLWASVFRSKRLSPLASNSSSFLVFLGCQSV
jgi:hypothetical protein